MEQPQVNKTEEDLWAKYPTIAESQQTGKDRWNKFPTIVGTQEEVKDDKWAKYPTIAESRGIDKGVQAGKNTEVQNSKQPGIVLPEPSVEKVETITDRLKKLLPPKLPEVMPKKTPDPLEQYIIHEKYMRLLPQPLSQRVKEAAIELQRNMEYGVIKKPPPFRPGEAIKNIPENISDAVRDVGSLLLFTLSLAKNTVLDHDRFQEQIRPGVDFTAAVINDVKDLVTGRTKITKEGGFLKHTKERPVVKAVKKHIKEQVEYWGPWGAIAHYAEERPLDTALMVTAGEQAVAKGVRFGAETLSKALKTSRTLNKFLDVKRTPVVFEMPFTKIDKYDVPVEDAIAKTYKFSREYSKDPFIKYAIQKPFDRFIDKYPKAKKAIAKHKAGKLMNQLRNQFDEIAYAERARNLEEAMKMLNSVPRKERELLVPYLEGRLSLLGEPTDAFKNFERWYRQYTDKVKKETLSDMSYKDIQEVLYGPIIKATGSKLEDVIRDLGDFTPAYVHQLHEFPKNSILPKFDATGKRYKPGYSKRRMVGEGYSEDMSKILPHWISQYVKYKNTEAYLNDITDKFGVPVNISRVKETPNGFKVKTKKTKNGKTVEDYKLFEGYKILAPDGLLSFYRGKIDMYKEAVKRLADMDFDEAIGSVINETEQIIKHGAESYRSNILIENRVKEALQARGFKQGEVEQMISRLKTNKAGETVIIKEKLVKSGMSKEKVANLFKTEPKRYTGVAKNKTVYLIPENVAKNLKSFSTPIFGSEKVQDFFRVYWDTPTQYWKDNVLAASPRWIKNNLAGDIVLSVTEGLSPINFSRGFYKKYKNVIPDELLQASFANQMKYRPEIGKTTKSITGQLINRIEGSLPGRVISKAKDLGYAANTMIENPFVRGMYIDKARTLAKERLKTRGVEITEDTIMNELALIKKTPKLKNRIVNAIKETLPVFNNLTNFERKYIKRIIPFYNFFKFMAVYGAKLPANHPFKTVAGRGLGALSEKQREQAFVSYFPYMENYIERHGIPDEFDNLWPIRIKDNGDALFFNARGINLFTTIQDIAEKNISSAFNPILTIAAERFLGRRLYTGQEFKTGEEGLNVDDRAKPMISWEKHIGEKFPLYKLLAETLTPAKQYDAGGLYNPQPVLDKVTGEYRYPVDAIEKWLNYIGISKKTLDIEGMWKAMQQKRARAINMTFGKYQSLYGKHLSFEDLIEIKNAIEGSQKTMRAIQNEIIRKKKQSMEEKQTLHKKLVK